MLFNDLFASFLVSHNVINQNDVEPYLQSSNVNAEPLSSVLIKNNVLDEQKVYESLSSFLHIELRAYQLNEIDIKLANRFPREKLIEFQVVPYSEDDKYIYMGFSNPFRKDEINELRFNVNKEIKLFLVVPSQITKLLEYIDNKAQQTSVLTEYNDENKNSSEQLKENIGIDAPIIKLCDSILKDAISRGASDIHIEPFENEVRVRLRIDGKLLSVDSIPVTLYQAVLARYKIMAEMNIAERRVPQDGKISLDVKGVPYDFRVSTIPTINGEKIVIRIYNVSFSSDNLDALGFSKRQQELVLQMITRPHGIILLTGPTGSGKSTSMYAFLRYLNKEDTNIITVEDPVENQIVGINQVQVNVKANMTFANALRSILRQDPNVIMIGEIRDEETANIATRAAITGHLVLSTIHTNDVAGVITRLINMGIPRYLVADALLGAISQRLVRKLCPECKEKRLTTLAEMHMLGLDHPVEIYHAKGCRKCNNTGYSGRIGVFEIMVLDERMRELIMSDDFNTERLNEILNQKMQSILDNAKERVLNGETSFEEFEQLSDVVRVSEKLRKGE